MKYYLLLSLMLCFSVYANNSAFSPGLYRIESDHSKIDFLFPSSEHARESYSIMKGNLKLKEDFQESEMEVEAESGSPQFGKVSLSNIKIIGSISRFQLIGELAFKQVVKKISFDTVYLGQVSDELGKVKAAFLGKARIRPSEFGISLPSIPDEMEIDLKILATRPSEMNVEFINSVLEISKLDY